MGRMVCHDCGAKVGRLHRLGCDNERCPFCYGQLVTCECCYENLDLDSRLEPTCSEGLNEEQEKRWEEILSEKGRIPYIRIPVLCGLCGKKYPNFFIVPNEEWRKFVIPLLQKEVLCLKCYEKMKKLFSNGWMMAKSHNVL